MLELNDAAAGKKLAEKVEWTPAQKAAYEKVAKTINSQMLDLYPIEKQLPTFIVYDSSNVGSGGYLYQKRDNKVQIVRLWSKKRGDSKLKTQWSSCQLELFGILNCVLFFH